MENIAVLGGSFDPTTLAHIQIATEVYKLPIIDQILMLPSGERTDKKQKISIEHKKEIMKVSQKILTSMGVNTGLDMYFLEGKNGDYTTTAQEELYLREKLGVSPHFIYGSDIIPQMPKWYGNKDKFIEEKLKKIFIQRPEYNFDPEEYGIKNFMFLDIPDMLNISSSMAREMIVNKQSVSKILHPEVIEYIEKNKLYR